MASSATRAQIDESNRAEDEVHAAMARKLIEESHAAIYCVDTTEASRDLRVATSLASTGLITIPAAECTTEHRGKGPTLGLVVEAKTGKNAHIVHTRKFERLSETEARIIGSSWATTGKIRGYAGATYYFQRDEHGWKLQPKKTLRFVE